MVSNTYTERNVILNAFWLVVRFSLVALIIISFWNVLFRSGGS